MEEATHEDDRLGLICIAAGTAATAGWSIYEYLIKPLAIATAIILAAAAALAIPAVPITILFLKNGETMLSAIVGGVVFGLMAIMLTVIAATMIREVADKARHAIKSQWNKHGRPAALECRQRRRNTGRQEA